METKLQLRRYLWPGVLSALAWWSPAIVYCIGTGNLFDDGLMPDFAYLLTWPVVVPAVFLYASSPPAWVETMLEKLDPGFLVDTNFFLLFLFWAPLSFSFPVAMAMIGARGKCCLISALVIALGFQIYFNHQYFFKLFS